MNPNLIIFILVDLSICPSIHTSHPLWLAPTKSDDFGEGYTLHTLDTGLLQE